MSAVPKISANDSAAPGQDSRDMLHRSRSNELFIAIVGPAGAGSGTVATVLKGLIGPTRVDEVPYDVVVVKASREIREWAQRNGLEVPSEDRRKSLDDMVMMQNRGDDMRKQTGDNAAVARAVIRRIVQLRAEASGIQYDEGTPVAPDGKPRAYIIDSLRHPAEVHLLRKVYQDAFALVGVVCDPEVREKRLRTNLFDFKAQPLEATRKAITNFMERDADSPEKHGQHVTDTFHEADFFVDNSEEAKDQDLTRTQMNEPLNRLIGLMTVTRVLRPTIAETAMHHAHSARLRSSCMSRQVGAALVDQRGNVVATGTNEVPAAGGGVYGEGFDRTATENRCVFRETRVCSSNQEQNTIINELIDRFPELLGNRTKEEALKEIRATRIGSLIEFSRAVHAEMDAILSAARVGVSPVGGRLFVTTFPCHYCARHIVTSGIDEVQYIEPYPKSRALPLHSDSIATREEGWVVPSRMASVKQEKPSQKGGGETEREEPRVLFRPFVGVAPRMYGRVFLKDRSYKDKVTGDYMLEAPDWGGPSDIFQVSYTSLEAELSKAF